MLNRLSETYTNKLPSLSIEEENYVRMVLLLTGISPRAVRALIDHEFHPSCLDASIKKEYNKLLEMKKIKIINQPQWNLLFTQHPDVSNSDTFDVTLMISILSNLPNLNIHQGGYDRLPSAVGPLPGADLARIKYYRNYLSHLDDAKIYKTLFTPALEAAWEPAWEDINEESLRRTRQKTMKLIDKKPINYDKFAHFRYWPTCSRKLPNMLQGRMNWVEPEAITDNVLNAVFNDTEKIVIKGNMLDSVHINMSRTRFSVLNQYTWAKEVTVESFDALKQIFEIVIISISASQNTIPFICVDYSPTTTEHRTHAKSVLKVTDNNILSKSGNKMLLFLYFLITFGTHQLLSPLKSASFSNSTGDFFWEAFLNGDLVSWILKQITNQVKLVVTSKASVHNDMKRATDRKVKNYWFIKSEYALCSKINGYIDENYKQTTINDGLQRNTKSLKVTFRSRTLIFTLFFVVLSLLKSGSCEEIKVTWNMKTNMTIFGKTAELECLISDFNNLCNRTLRQWYGGKPYGFLCRNGSCRNQKKYLEQKNAMCKYTLEISNFSENDVNCEYTCSYGVHRSRQMLKLDKEHFAYIPSMNDVKYSENSNMDMLNASVLIPKAFPEPACQVLFAGKIISAIYNITSTGEMYRTEIRVVYKPLFNMCKGALDISCMIGSSKFTPVYKNITVCKGVSDQKSQHTESETGVYVVIVFVAVLVLVATVCVYKKVHKRLSEKCGKLFNIYNRTPTDEPSNVLTGI